MKNHYITSPIFYVNAAPHIGHLYTSVVCDTIARICKMQGCEVRFTTGTDEHGQKIEQSAQKNDQSPLEFAETISNQFREMVRDLRCCNTDFIRTTEDRHKQTVQKVWQKLVEKGHIYLGKYSGFYCTREETFFQESELINGKTPDGGEVFWLEEESYFFRLSNFKDRLLKFYDQNPNFILPANRLNEVKSFVKRGLKDLSVSRKTIKWGIPVPENPAHTIYVWIDALTNYLSSLGYLSENNEEFQNFWQNGKKIHVLGKDILRFHAIYWPAILMALDLPLPDQLIVHGWWLNEGEKISKSLGNVIASNTLIRDYDLDSLRYFLLREVNLGDDGNFKFESLVARVNNELASNVGNLVNRTFAMVKKYLNLELISLSELQKDPEFEPLCQNLVKNAQEIQQLMIDFHLHRALERIFVLSSNANALINKYEPWKMSGEPEKLAKLLTLLILYIKAIGILLQPFTPEKSRLILQSFGMNEANFSNLETILIENINIQIVPNRLFEKIINKDDHD